MSVRRKADPRHDADEAVQAAESHELPDDAEAADEDDAVEGVTPIETPDVEATRDEDDAKMLKDRWLRAEADLQNFKRRAARDREEARRLAEESVILDVISVMDDLDRAIEAARGAEVEDSWVEGFELVATRLRDVLSRRGVSQLDPIGAPFDPEFHEALLEIDAPEGAAPGDVVQVALKGYARDGRALRAARVVVARETPEGD